jgi:hypothetical protein
MPVTYNKDKKKWCVGESCIYSSKEKAEAAQEAMYAEMQKKKTINTELAKSFDEDKKLFTSIVLKANYRDMDAEGNEDYWSEKVVEEAAHDFLLNCMQGNISHIVNTDLVKFVESYIAPVDFEMGEGQVNKGDWIATVKIMDDELWQMCKDGLFNGFSVGCSAIVEVEDD